MITQLETYESPDLFMQLLPGNCHIYYVNESGKMAYMLQEKEALALVNERDIHYG